MPAGRGDPGSTTTRSWRWTRWTGRSGGICRRSRRRRGCGS